MRFLINGLSATNLSGGQVLCGHLVEGLRQTQDDDQWVLLLHAANADVLERLREDWGGPLPEGRFRVVRAPGWTASWFGRTIYERLYLGRCAAKVAADAVLGLAGGWTGGVGCPQYTLALNPWALASLGPRGVADRMKARLQRHTYRTAVRRAAGIGYGSLYMRDRYRELAGSHERAWALVYPALGGRDVAALDAVRAAAAPRDPYNIICVSLMSPHKDIETLLEALRRLRDGGLPQATLTLAGGWADARYRERIMARIAALGLREAVAVTGYLERGALCAAYGRAAVYCLLSRSESFGIPAIEAQRVGTPVVAADACAAPEVCGAGGLYVPPGDAEAAAGALAQVLTDAALWRRLSAAAEQNARRFEYRLTTRPLLAMLGASMKEPHGA